MIRLRIGIVSWNTEKLLDECLAALPAATDGSRCEVVVVDNDSSDGSAQVARRHLGVQVMANPANVGYGRAMNQALQGSDDADVLIALNPDTVPAPGSLVGLAERLLQQPDVGLVAPRLDYPGGKVQHSVYRFPSVAVSAAASFLPARLQQGPVGRRLWLEGAAPHDRAEDIDWAIGAVHAIRPAALEKCPPYDERWWMYVEDLDLCWQLAQRGWRRRFEPDFVVVHVGNASGSQAWGGERTGRWLDATYEWYRLRRGAGSARLWAAVNTVGVGTRIVRAGGRRALGGSIAGWERELPAAFHHHVRALLR